MKLKISIDFTRLAEVKEEQNGLCSITLRNDVLQVYKQDNGEVKAFLNLIAFETKDNKFGKSHFLKLSRKYEDYVRMSEEERKALPIVGSIKPLA